MLLLGVLLLAVLALAAACGGGGGDDGEDRASGLSPAELLQQSSDAARALESFRAEVALTGTVGLADSGSVPGGALLNGPIEISGEGPVDPPDAASLDLELATAGPRLQLNITRSGDKLYAGLLGQDYELPVSAAQAGLLDLGALYPTLASWTVDPAAGGEEEIDGTGTTRIDGTIDPAKALAGLAPLLGADAPTAAQAREMLKEGTVQYWVGTSDLKPRRVHLVLKAEGGDVVHALRDIDLDLTVTLTDLDEPVNIEPPTNARPLDLDGLGGFLG